MPLWIITHNTWIFDDIDFFIKLCYNLLTSRFRRFLNMSMRLVTLIAFGLFLSTSASAQEKSIPVYVFTSIDAPASAVGTSGFLDPQAEKSAQNAADEETRKLGDSLQDIKAALSKKRGIRLVENPEDAVIRLQVESRNDFSMNPFSSTYLKNIRGSAQTIVLRTRLTVGEYSQEITGKPIPLRAPGWRGAAEHVARQVENWVERNHIKLNSLTDS
jgi:hypothetical protein